MYNVKDYSYIFNKVMKFLYIVVLLAYMVVELRAAPIVDGKFEGLAEGYDLTLNLVFNLENSGEVHGGHVSFATDRSGSGDHFMYYSMPRAYVDNTYGDNAVGWGKKGHTFDALLLSDKFGINTPVQFNTLTSGVVKVIIDYLAEEKLGGGPPLGYRSGGVKQGEDASLIKNDGSVVSGDATGIKEVATSLEYNINRFASAEDIANDTGVILNSPESDENYNPLNSQYNDWIWDVGYEFRFDESWFDSRWTNRNEVLNLIGLGEPHASPAKDLYLNSVVVPEPSTYMLMIVSLIGYCFFRKRCK